MFGNKNTSKNRNSPKAKAGAADTLICKQTKITGDINFTGVLYVDGHIRGNISAEDLEDSLLTIGTNGYVEGEINVPHVMILGRVKGDVHALEHVELMPNSRVEGDVYYKLIEMTMGAEVNGQMVHKIEKQKLLGHHAAEVSKQKAANDNKSNHQASNNSIDSDNMSFSNG
ncbi:MAG: polymer-forming cytoskeletal protein [Kangiellaceae bacterium]|nr:polymer-forming cytoskeletal protein [Kangiellaceae bacterium]